MPRPSTVWDWINNFFEKKKNDELLFLNYGMILDSGIRVKETDNESTANFLKWLLKKSLNNMCD